MSRRLIVVLVAAITLIAILSIAAIAPAGAQTPANATNQTTDQAPNVPDNVSISESDYSYQKLSDGGVLQNVDTVESVRALGNPPKGFAALRYRDPTLIDAITGSPGRWSQVENGEPVTVNELQLYGSAFGETSGEYEVVVVHWDRYSPANSSETIAANQSVYRHSVEFSEDDLYSYHNMSLAKHLDSAKETTVWLEKPGGAQSMTEGVQWRFVHKSNPATETVNIRSAQGAWGFAIGNVFLPGVIAMIAGFGGSRMVLRQTGRGPGYGIGSWLFIVGFIAMVLGVVAYYQIAVILNNFPWVMGITLGAISFAIGLTVHNPVKKIAFKRRELADAELIPGGPPQRKASDGGTDVNIDEVFGGDDAGAELFDEFTEALYVDLPEVPAVRTDDGYRVPVPGVKAFFARLFASAATLDVSNIATRTKVKKGRIDDIITVDPKAGEALSHRPARLTRVLPWDTIDHDEIEWQDRAIAGIQTASIIVVPPAAGYFALGAALDIPWVGVIIGAIVTLVLSYSAVDGEIEFEQAPPMYDRAEDSLTVLQRAYKEAKEEKSAREVAWTEKAKTQSEARKERGKERGVVTDEVLDALGADSSVDVDTSDESDDVPALDEEEDAGGDDE